MPLTEGVINPENKNPHDMFIGWDKAPAVDRRFLLGALPLGLIGAGGASWLIANELGDPGAGAWLTNATHTVTGFLATHPYPMIRMPDPAAPFGVRTILIVAQGKCTSALNFENLLDAPVTASGFLIQRKGRQMLEVPPFADEWLIPAASENIADNISLPKGGTNLPVFVTPMEETLGTARLVGTIMDSKCFFGVMKPARGKTHKACASLCIRGGIPPSIWVRTKDGRETVMLMTTANGDPMPMDILPLVADPVEAEGEILRVGDLLQFRADADAYKRI